MSPLLSDTLLDRRYRVRSRLGAGGMAEVYLVRDEATGTDCALKILVAGRVQGRPDLAARFRREFLSASRVVHPGVIKLLDQGALPDGSSYYTMEYLPWPSLETFIAHEAPLAEERVLSITGQILDALAACHPAGVVHRDLKPANVILADGDRVVLVDFGLVKDVNATTMTRTGALVGTPLYFAPEMAVGAPVDERYDLFAVGVITYEMLTGRHPFADAAKTLGKLVVAITTEEAVPVTLRRPDLSPAWDDFVGRCMRREPAARPASAVDARAALAAVEAQVARRRSGGPPVPPRARAPRPSPPLPPPRPASDSAALVAVSWSASLAALPRRKAAMALTAAVTVIVVGALALVSALAPRRSYTVHGARVEGRPGAVLVTWTSDEPYPSRLEMDGRLLPSHDLRPTVEHRVLVAGLDDERPHRFRVVFPSLERSLPLDEGRAVPVSLDRFTAEPAPGGGLLLAWDAGLSDDTTCRIELLEPLRRTLPVARLSAHRWEAALPVLTPPLARARVVTVHGDGVETVADLGTRLAGIVGALARRMATHPAEAAVVQARDEVDARLPVRLAAYRARTGVELVPEGFTSSVRQEEFALALLRHLTTSGVRDAFDEARTLMPLLDATDLVPTEDRLRLYRELVGVVRLGLVSFQEGNSFPLERPPLPPFGHLTLGLSPHPGPARTVPLEPAALSWPAVLGPPTAFSERRPRTTVAMGGVVPDGPTPPWAELVLRTTAFRNFTLRLRVGERGEVILYDRPCFLDRGEDTVTYVQRIPPEWLTPGPVSVTLTAERLFHATPRNTTTLHGVELRLGR